MSNKFTPGEWRVCELTRRFGVYDSSGTSIAKIDGDYGVAMERRKADAHLIAAAPDLYEALDSLVKAQRAKDKYDFIDSDDNFGDGGQRDPKDIYADYENAWAAALSALKKAGGES